NSTGILDLQRLDAACCGTIPQLHGRCVDGPWQGGDSSLSSFQRRGRKRKDIMKLPPFEYACPATINEAVALLANHSGEAKPLAGGQSLMPMMAFRIAQPSLLVDLRKLPGLKDIKIGPDGVRLGALVRWRDILDDKRLTVAHPLLKEAISHVAHYQIRNRGTVGGSCAHADPASEMPG